jgi:thiamine kinase-like enzyme
MKLMQKIDKKIASVDHKIEIISSLKIDLISQIFLCNFNDIKSVIRVDFDIPNWLKKQRALEFQILNFLKTKTQNQKILYHNLDRGILIREFHEGKEISYFDIRRKEDLISLGKEIKKVHEIKIDNAAINNFENTIENYRDILKNKIKKNWYLNQGFKIFDSLSCIKKQIVFSHNDLHRQNILFNKKYFFIDWEYASANSLYFDLASIISSYDLNDEEISYLFDGYDKNFLLDQEKLRNWIKFTYFLDYIWRQCLIETTKHDEKTLGIIGLERNLDIFK